MSDASAGQIVGGVVGAVAGFIVTGGGPVGAVQGFADWLRYGWLRIDPPDGPLYYQRQDLRTRPYIPNVIRYWRIQYQTLDGTVAHKWQCYIFREWKIQGNVVTEEEQERQGRWWRRDR